MIDANLPLVPTMPTIEFLPIRARAEAQAQPRWISPSMVIRIAAVLYGIEENDLLSRRRNVRFEQARALVAWCLRAIPQVPMSYPKIGRAMDGRDHTSIINLHANAIALRLGDLFFAQCCLAMQRYFTAIDGGEHERP